MGAAPDMGWKESPFIALTTMPLYKSISNVILNNVSSLVIPGASIIFKIMYSNTGICPGRSVVIYDKIPLHAAYNTNIPGTASGWQMQFTTNAFPNQGFSSADYSNTYINKANIKWIRWEKSSVATSERGLSLVYRVIIK